MAAGITSLVLAMTDLVIVQVKRYKSRQKALQLPGGTPIIIKKPLGGVSEPSDANPPDSNLSDSNLPDIEPVEP
jgi:hypothetical protein